MHDTSCGTHPFFPTYGLDCERQHACRGSSSAWEVVGSVEVDVVKVTVRVLMQAVRGSVSIVGVWHLCGGPIFCPLSTPAQCTRPSHTLPLSHVLQHMMFCCSLQSAQLPFLSLRISFHIPCPLCVFLEMCTYLGPVSFAYSWRTLLVWLSRCLSDFCAHACSCWPERLQGSPIFHRCALSSDSQPLPFGLSWTGQLGELPITSTGTNSAYPVCNYVAMGHVISTPFLPVPSPIPYLRSKHLLLVGRVAGRRARWRLGLASRWSLLCVCLSSAM